MEITQQQQDVQGDLYEYLLSKLNTAGRNGQFRTPRHIIRMMVDDRAPPQGVHRRPRCRYLRISGERLPVHPRNPHLTGDPPVRRAGLPHNLIGDQLKEDELKALKSSSFRCAVLTMIPDDYAAHRLDEPDAARH